MISILQQDKLIVESVSTLPMRDAFELPKLLN